MIDLNQYLYAPIKSKIPDLSKKNRMDLLKSEFKFSNMSIGLLDKTSLDLFEEDGKMKLIYKIIHHNYLGLNRTLQIMNGKYYVNWINIVPILYKDLDDENKLVFKESKLYMKTKDGLDSLKKYLNNPKEFFNFTQHNYYGLYFGDIYNIIKIKLYDEIKHIKWLIYSLPVSTGNIYIIQYLNRQINFDNFFKYSSFEDIDLKDKINFEKFIQTTYTKMENNLLSINLWTQILLFLTNEYSQKNVVKKEISNIFQKFSFSPSIKEFDYIDEEEDKEYIKSINIKISKITASDIIEYLVKINVKHIWNFLYETITLLENTYLRDYFIKEEDNNGYTKKKINKTIYNYPGTNLSFKNIYNIAKSITHFKNNNNEWVSHDSHYVSFSLEQELIFFKKFLGVEDYTTWLNLRNNLKREFNINNDIQYNEKMDNINSDWNKIKLDLIFEILTKNGLLSEFNVVLDITDKNNYMKSISVKSQIYKKMESRMKKNEKWKLAYYYLTNQQYSKLPKLSWENEKTKVKKDYFYFELFSKDQNWYSFYAMDWISQINFFHRYIHHRVLYVTGATGVGKSTQVPKLLMYALKAYEMINNGKVVCTQPRIPPTKNNAERISEELGVPIARVIPKSMEKEKTDNFYVQMKYSEDSHIKDNCPHLILKILTDGTLYEELQNNPMMKEQIYNVGDEDFIYGYKNKYDIIILDESHEHNTNMDMILTLIRNLLFINLNYLLNIYF
jgi:hypothetical protein